MVIKTTRFGLVQVPETEILTFKEGILGFNHLTKFILLDDPNDEIFAWLQSTENGAVAFPLLEPNLFMSQYKPSVAKTDLEALGLSTGLDGAHVFCIITVPEDPTKMSANLKAPVIINTASKAAKQCVLQENSLAIREPIFTQLQQRVFQNPDKPLKSLSMVRGGIVKINPIPLDSGV